MATKPTDLLGRLPSANELLEKPPIRALADRWNRSVVAAGVRTFLEELRSDIERRAADVHLPSLHELAELAARHIASRRTLAVRPGINATGRIFSPASSGPPLADEALERIVSLGRGYVPDVPVAEPGDAEAILCRFTGAEAAVVISSYTGAVWLALAATSAGRCVAVARSDVGNLESGSTLASVAEAADVSLREVGAVDHTSAADYEAALDDQTAAILRHTSDHYRVTGQNQAIELESLVGLARDRERPLIDLLGAAPLAEGLPRLGTLPDTSLPSIAASISAGAHLVVVRGDGLIGGPRCGVILGARNLIERIASHSMFAAWHADRTTSAALQATVALYSDLQNLPQTIPLFQLLSASPENLRQRAERLAPQCAQATDVKLAAVVSSAGCLGLARVEDDKLPSYAIALTPADGDLHSLNRRLRNAPVPVIGRLEDGCLLLDLRTVLPRQDQRLVEMVVGPAALRVKMPDDSAESLTV